MAKSDKKPVGPVRVGLVGAGGFARQTIDCLPDCPDIEVVAVADILRDRAETAAQRLAERGQPGAARAARAARVYLDSRSMIVESDIDAVLMSLPHDEYPECVRLAASRGLHLLKEKPLARSFDEGMELVSAYERAERVFMIGTQRRFAPGFVAMKERMASGAGPFGRPFLVRSHFLFNWSGDFGWRGQKVKAGFGAFGDAGYHNVDLLTWLLGPPQDVYAMQSSGGRANPVHPYDTDDTGLCVLHYAGGSMGCIICSWVTQPEVLDVIVHAPGGTLIATPERFQMFDLAGKVADERAVTPEQAGRQATLGKLAAFVAAIRAGKRSYPCSARENLLNQAVIEAAYLSGRTGQPQPIQRMFEVHHRSIDEFLPRPAGPAGERTARPRPRR